MKFLLQTIIQTYLLLKPIKQLQNLTLAEFIAIQLAHGVRMYYKYVYMQ